MSKLSQFLAVAFSVALVAGFIYAVINLIELLGAAQ